MLLTSALILLGFVILGAGAEMLVAGASRLALRLGVTPLLVGMTVVAFGTSTPELAVSIDSTMAGLSGLALGNVVGSNIANIGLILGITAIIQPIRIRLELTRNQIPVMIGCSLVMGLLLLDGEMGMVDGSMLVLGLLVYTVVIYRQARREVKPDDPALESLLEKKGKTTRKESGRTSLNILLIITGLVLLIAGSRLFVANTVELARMLGISEAIIGLTLVAVGTSLPELATSVTAALRRQSDIAIGNVVGSNIFNILCVLGMTSIAGTIYSAQFSLIDFGVMLAFALVLLPFARTGLALTRFEGVLLLLGYCAYVAYLGMFASRGLAG